MVSYDVCNYFLCRNNVCPRCREVSHDNWTFDPLVSAFLKVYSENQSRSEENIDPVPAVMSSPMTNGDLPTLPNQETGASSGTRVKHKTSTKRPASSSEPASQKDAAQPLKKAKVDQRDLSQVPQKSSQVQILPSVTKGVINQPQGEDAAESNVLPGQNEIALEAYSIACKTAAKEANALAEKYPSSWEAGFTGPQRPSGYAVVYLYEDMIPNVERNSSTQGSWDIAVLTCPAHATMAQIKANISYAIKCDARKIVIDVCNRLKSNESFLDACRQIGAGKWCLKDSLTIRYVFC